MPTALPEVKLSNFPFYRLSQFMGAMKLRHDFARQGRLADRLRSRPQTQRNGPPLRRRRSGGGFQAWAAGEGEAGACRLLIGGNGLIFVLRYAIEGVCSHLITPALSYAKLPRHRQLLYRQIL
jgi:hypothetical protein